MSIDKDNVDIKSKERKDKLKSDLKKKTVSKDKKEKNSLMKISEAKQEISKVIVGQQEMVERVLLSIFLGGHILLEGLPGLAKSLTVDVISKVMGLSFNRIQFTPDILPSDIIGTQIYFQKSGEFVTKKGPLFSDIILADEINRAPPKVQSALLESMQERQVTIGDTTYGLGDFFTVLATQNPIEQDGTYPLPEAQQDRFMFKLSVKYPSKEEELKILDIKHSSDVKATCTKEDILSIRNEIDKVHVEDRLKQYIVDLVFKSRETSKHIKWGASPRASISLLKASKGIALFRGRDYVTAEDIKSVAIDVLRHRVVLSYEAEIDNITESRLVENLINVVRMP